VAEGLRAIRRLVGTLQESARAVEHQTGLTNAQLFLLRAVQAREGLSINDLATAARTQQSAASIIVQRLVRAGLLRRRRADEDARRVVLSLSPAGRRKLRRAPAPPTTRLLEGLQDLTDRERRALLAGLHALERRLGAEDAEPGMLFEAVPPRRRNRRADGSAGNDR